MDTVVENYTDLTHFQINLDAGCKSARERERLWTSRAASSKEVGRGKQHPKRVRLSHN